MHSPYASGPIVFDVQPVVILSPQDSSCVGITKSATGDRRKNVSPVVGADGRSRHGFGRSWSTSVRPSRCRRDRLLPVVPERVSQRLTILAEDGRSKLRSPTKTVGVNHFAIRSQSR